MYQASNRRLPLLLAALCLLAAAAVAFVAVPALDAAVSGCQAVGATTLYFNKPGGRVVGTYRSDCQGNCTGTGAVTPYYEVTNFLPCPPPNPEP